MPRLFYATTNAGKVVSLRRHLAPEGFEVIQRPLVLPEPRLDRVEDMAIYKAIFAFQELRHPVLALDAGFSIYGLRGFPHTFVNFALDTIQIDGLLRLAVHTDRRCAFTHALAYHDGQDDTPAIFVDYVLGMLATEPRGVIKPHHWSELSSIFIPSRENRTLAEMDEVEYEHWSDARRKNYSDTNYAQQFITWYRVHRPATASTGG